MLKFPNFLKPYALEFKPYRTSRSYPALPFYPALPYFTFFALYIYFLRLSSSTHKSLPTFPGLWRLVKQRVRFSQLLVFVNATCRRLLVSSYHLGFPYLLVYVQICFYKIFMYRFFVHIFYFLKYSLRKR